MTSAISQPFKITSILMFFKHLTDLLQILLQYKLKYVPNVLYIESNFSGMFPKLF